MRPAELFVAVAAAWIPSLLSAQEGPPTGTQVSALPAVNYDSDEGVGYGLTGGIYAYGNGGRRPYVWAVEPLVFFTTMGRREVSSVLDIPYALGGRVRVTAVGAFERDCCLPYYGVGNATARDEALAVRDTLPGYYTYRRRRWSVSLDLQWRVRARVRFLTGYAANHNAAESRDPNTLFAIHRAAGEIGADEERTVAAGLRAGVVFDTRDNERDPRRGVWIDGLVWQGATVLGSDFVFTRLTGTARVYVPVGAGFTAAARILGEHVSSRMPITMLPDIASSFRDFAGVGGSKSVRGVLRMRYLGRSRLVSNLEMRWRGRRFDALGQSWRPGVVSFIDAGRVWDRSAANGDGFGLHVGAGGGFRITWGESFIVAADVAYGSEAGLQTYLGLGHLF